MSGNAAHATAVGKVVNSEEGQATFLCLLLAGAAPDMGESHRCFSSDAHPFCRDGPNLVARRHRPAESVEDACESALPIRSEVVAGYRAGQVVDTPFQFVGGCPIRFQVGGCGASRFLGMSPLLAPRCAVRSVLMHRIRQLVRVSRWWNARRYRSRDVLVRVA